MTRLTLRARYVFPATSDPIPDGFVAIEGGRIVDVGPCRAGGPPAIQNDLGNVAIIPGLVNAHAHLDFSRLSAPLGHRGIALPDWIRLAMAYRRQAADQLPSALFEGLSECLRHGVTTVADIVQPGWSPIAAPLNLAAFLELIGPTADRVPVAIQLANTYLKNAASPGENSKGCVSFGLSPHAPYSVHPQLLTAIVRLSVEKAVPLAMHLAESPEELELLQNGTGPLRDLLDDIKSSRGPLVAEAGAAPHRGSRPMDFLRSLSPAFRALIVHGNYLSDDEIAFLGTNALRMAAVYCPRSHDWFGHQPYPLENMLRAGVTVGLGTDGRGSAPDLNLLAEMRLIAKLHPGVGLDWVLKLGTLSGAEALGRADSIGSLSPGKRADLAIVALPDRDAKDPHELLFDSEKPVTACWLGGEQAWAADRQLA